MACHRWASRVDWGGGAEPRHNYALFAMNQLPMLLQFKCTCVCEIYTHTHTLINAVNLTERVNFEASVSVHQKKCNFSPTHFRKLPFLYMCVCVSTCVCVAAAFAIAFLIKCINLNVATNCHYQSVRVRIRFCF